MELEEDSFDDLLAEISEPTSPKKTKIELEPDRPPQPGKPPIYRGLKSLGFPYTVVVHLPFPVLLACTYVIQNMTCAGFLE